MTDNSDDISIQCATDDPAPDLALMKSWCQQTIEHCETNGEITLRIVNSDEMTLYNQQFRDKSGPTNVLSFPANLPTDVTHPLLGDIIICAIVVNREAAEQHKSMQAHWAHMVVHGILHLLGFDHQEDGEAKIMETKEIELLQKMGFSNPYEVDVEGQA